MAHIPRNTNEAHLLESDFGFEVLDAIVQANVDLNRVTVDELNQMVVQFSTHPKRKAVARLIRDRKRPVVEQPTAGVDDPRESLVMRRRHRSRAAILREKIHFA